MVRRGISFPSLESEWGNRPDKIDLRHAGNDETGGDSERKNSYNLIEPW